jgi:hypothetical protein
MQKLSVHIGGHTAKEAIELIEDLFEIKVNAEDRAVMMALEGQGGGKIARGNMFSVDAEDEQPTDQARALLDELFGNPLSSIEQLYGKAPPYNGVLGDSCDCPACNLRRGEGMVDLLRDADELSMRVEQSRAAVIAGYSKTGRLTPPEAINPAPTKEHFEAVEREAAAAKVRAGAVNARTTYSVMVNDDPKKMADFDRMVEIASRPNKWTADEKREAGELLIKTIEEATKSFQRGR